MRTCARLLLEMRLALFSPGHAYIRRRRLGVLVLRRRTGGASRLSAIPEAPALHDLVPGGGLASRAAARVAAGAGGGAAPRVQLIKPGLKAKHAQAEGSRVTTLHSKSQSTFVQNQLP